MLAVMLVAAACWPCSSWCRRSSVSPTTATSSACSARSVPARGGGGTSREVFLRGSATQLRGGAGGLVPDRTDDLGDDSGSRARAKAASRTVRSRRRVRPAGGSARCTPSSCVAGLGLLVVGDRAAARGGALDRERPCSSSFSPTSDTPRRSTPSTARRPRSCSCCRRSAFSRARSPLPRRRDPRWAAALRPSCAWAFRSGSKPQEALQGIRARRASPSGCGWRWRARGRAKRRRGGSRRGARRRSFSASWGVVLRQTPPEIADVAKYHKVFMELLCGFTPEPEPGSAGSGPRSSVDVGDRADGLPAVEPLQRSGVPVGVPRALQLCEARCASTLTHPVATLAATIWTRRARGAAPEASALRKPRAQREDVPPGRADALLLAGGAGCALALPGHAAGLDRTALWIANLVAVAATYAPRLDPRAARARGPRPARRDGVARRSPICVLANAHGGPRAALLRLPRLTDLSRRRRGLDRRGARGPARPTAAPSVAGSAPYTTTPSPTITTSARTLTTASAGSGRSPAGKSDEDDRRERRHEARRRRGPRRRRCRPGMRKPGIFASPRSLIAAEKR